MMIPFITRNPTNSEFERFRLILSTYQDGSGQLIASNGQTLPGWRDFERSIALTFAGEAQENKFIFDVLIPSQEHKSRYYGISCKMRRTLDETKRTGRVTLELSNSSGAFWDKLRQYDINQQNYKSKPEVVAQVLMAQVNEWHEAVSLDQGGIVDIANSFYLALSWNKRGKYQMFKFPLSLPDPSGLNWDFPIVHRNNEEALGRRLRGQDKNGCLFEWYGESGGQLKYYPLVEYALWKSEIFYLEKLPDDWNEKHGIVAKVRSYFPDLWSSL